MPEFAVIWKAKDNHLKKITTMYTGLLHLHSGLAYLVLLVLAACIVYAAIGALSGREFTERDRKFALIGMVLTHVQFLVGLILYFVSPLGLSNFSGEAMGDSLARLYMLEHPLINLIAVVLITIGHGRAKRLSVSKVRFRNVYMFYAVGLILILSRIPWSTWLN